MYIHAKKGHKVVVTRQSIRNGLDMDKKIALKYLQVWVVYTVEKTEIHDWHTNVYLKEIQGEYFNSVLFEDFIP